MPLPKPSGEEDHNAFIARCMGNEVMNAEYPDSEQRYAVCTDLWERRGKEGNAMDDDKLRCKLYGDCEGPLGFPMKSAAAKELEKVIASLNPDCRAMVEKAGGPVRKASAEVDKYEFLEGEHADISLITTGAVDRDNEVVVPNGGDWKSFKDGGSPVTFAHKYDQLPVGRALWVKHVKEPKDGWLAKTLYKQRPEDWPEGQLWFPDAVFAFVQDGMRGKSIGFIPLDVSPPTEKDIQARPELTGVNLMIRKWVGLEYAALAVQSNPEAVTQTVAKAADAGIIVPQIVLDTVNLAAPAEDKAFTHNSKVAEDAPDWGSVDKTNLPRAAFARMGEVDKVSSWGFPHHWVRGGGAQDEDGRYTTGTMFLHEGGLNAAWAAAQGARAGEEAEAEVKSHLNAHRTALGKAPEEFDCECIECGEKVKSEEHCNTIKCPKCGGTMRRAERPGPGQPAPDKKPRRRVPADSDEARASRTPEEVQAAMMGAIRLAGQSVDPEAVAQAVVERMQGRI